MAPETGSASNLHAIHPFVYPAAAWPRAVGCGPLVAGAQRETMAPEHGV